MLAASTGMPQNSLGRLYAANVMMGAMHVGKKHIRINITV